MRGQRPNVISKYTVVFCSGLQAGPMWHQMFASSASYFDTLIGEGDSRDVIDLLDFL
jgi:hypothetical protein